ncbi:radical SAM/SPASM domain-containing protein [Clostridium tyrobutyricum]|uniref:radical SAM/SPASM domain-containing protein n=1 Tax=Clostridium tyrobutyricum TaxID=1519 RepID=UPI001C39577F|nr:radical SAM protein [Clostridium tyrobutyricum]MBV4421994.1 radical SAM protein [Clostridium tyrobutyricum]
MKRNNPFKKIYQLCDTGDSLSKKNNIPRIPRYIDIELTNYCNYNCFMCPVGTGMMKRQQGFMSDNTYNIILNQIKDYKIPIRFIRWGEPTLHKKFIEYIIEAKKLGIICHFNTNGTLLTEEDIKQLIEIELDSIKFSFQGVDEKSYSEMRNSNYYNSLLDKIKLVHKMRGNKQFPYIHVASTITYETKNQINDFKKNIQEYCDLVTIGRTVLEHIDIDKVKLSLDKKDMLKELKTKESVIKKHYNCCPEIFDKLSINWNGDVTACCRDYDNKMLVGNINESSLIDIWNSDKINSFRKILGENKYDKLELCKTCYDYMALETDNLQEI